MSLLVESRGERERDGVGHPCLRAGTLASLTPVQAGHGGGHSLPGAVTTVSPGIWVAARVLGAFSAPVPVTTPDLKPGTFPPLPRKGSERGTGLFRFPQTHPEVMLDAIAACWTAGDGQKGGCCCRHAAAQKGGCRCPWGGPWSWR